MVLEIYSSGTNNDQKNQSILCPIPMKVVFRALLSRKNIEVVYPQLWIFDFDIGSWTCLGTGSNGDGGKCAGPGAPAVFDHTATLVGNNEHIVVVGGITVGQAVNSQASRRQGAQAFQLAASCQAFFSQTASRGLSGDAKSCLSFVTWIVVRRFSPLAVKITKKGHHYQEKR